MNSLVAKLFSLRLLSNLPKSALLPYLAVWLIHYEHLSVAHAALVVGIYIVMYRSGALLFTSLIAKRSLKLMLIMAWATVTSLHVLLYLLAQHHVENYVWWFLTAMSLGCMISIITVIILSYQSKLSSSQVHKSFYAYMNMAFNLGAGIAPFMGAYILHHYPNLLPLAPSVVGLVALLISFALPSYQKPQQQTGSALGLLKNKRFMKFICMSAMSLVGIACFYDLFPLYTHGSIPTTTVGGLFVFGAVLIVALQMPLSRMANVMPVQRALFIANVLLAASVLLLFFGKSQLLIAIAGVTVLSISEMIFLPIYQAQTIKLAGETHGPHAFSWLIAMWGLAEAFAATAGTYLIMHGYANITFITAFVVCLLVGVYFLMSRNSDTIAT